MFVVPIVADDRLSAPAASDPGELEEPPGPELFAPERQTGDPWDSGPVEPDVWEPDAVDLESEEPAAGPGQQGAEQHAAGEDAGAGPGALGQAPPGPVDPARGEAPPPTGIAHDDVPEVSEEQPAWPSSAPVALARRRRVSGRTIVLSLGFVAACVVLGAVGLVIGRLLRDDSAGTPSRTAASTPARTTPAAAKPKPRWGPFVPASAGTLSSPSARAAVAVAGGRVAVIGGTAGTPIQLGRPGGKLRRVGALPSRLASAAAMATSDALYVIGGEWGGDTPSDGIQRVDLASHEVTSAGAFVEPLAGAGYVQDRGSLLIAGGWTGDQYATAILRFTPPATVDLIVRLPEAVRDPAVALRGGKLFVVGGRTESGPSRNVYVVDLDARSVRELGRLPRPVAGASLVAAGGTLYLLGGNGPKGPEAGVVRIDPSKGRITAAGRMPRPLAFAGAATVGGKTYVLGGKGASGPSAAIVRLAPR